MSTILLLFEVLIGHFCAFSYTFFHLKKRHDTNAFTSRPYIVANLLYHLYQYHLAEWLNRLPHTPKVGGSRHARSKPLALLHWWPRKRNTQALAGTCCLGQQELVEVPTQPRCSSRSAPPFLISGLPAQAWKSTSARLASPLGGEPCRGSSLPSLPIPLDRVVKLFASYSEGRRFEAS